MFKLRSIAVGLMLLTTALLPRMSSAQGAQAKVTRNQDDAIIAALEKKIDKFDFVETPLIDVVEFIEDDSNINIELDTRALDTVGIGLDTPITRNLSGISLRSALRLILRELELTYTIEDEALIITTPEEAEDRLSTVVYEVRDLVKREAPVDTLVYSPFGTASDFDSLIEIMTSTIAPDSWDEVGGPGSVGAYEYAGKSVLIISQTHEIHEQITDLLEALRKIEVKGKPKAKTTEVSDGKKDEVFVRVYPMSGFATVDVDEVAELIRQVIGEEMWSDERGTFVSGKVKTVIVKHNRAVHDKVYEVLVGIEAIQAKGPPTPLGQGLGGGLGTSGAESAAPNRKGGFF